MKLIGRDIDGRALLQKARARLRARGIDDRDITMEEVGPEPVVEPLSFLVQSLEENEDPTMGLPIRTHRTGLGQAVPLVKWVFRHTCQVLINEALGRQHVFNAQVRDMTAQLAAEVIQLRERLAALESARGRASAHALPASERPRTRKAKHR
jgi:hypothetical protein